jgi:hypothetical protein
MPIRFGESGAVTICSQQRFTNSWLSFDQIHMQGCSKGPSQTPPNGAGRRGKWRWLRRGRLRQLGWRRGVIQSGAKSSGAAAEVPKGVVLPDAGVAPALLRVAASEGAAGQHTRTGQQVDQGCACRHSHDPRVCTCVPEDAPLTARL